MDTTDTVARISTTHSTSPGGRTESRATAPSSALQTIDFRTLSRSVQERFVACVAGTQQPSPLVATQVRSYAPHAWASVIFASAVLLVAFIGWGFGDLHSTQAVHHARAIATYGVLISAIALGVVQLAILRMRRESLPFPRGVYCFPVSLVDARAGLVRVYSLADLLTVERDAKNARAVRLMFASGEAFSFETESSGAAEGAVARIESARAEAKALRGGPDDPRITMMFTLDPLQRPRISSPLGPRSPLTRDVPGWTDKAWVIAPLIGFALALPLRHLRDAASDARMYQRATAAGDAESLRAYLAQGGKRSDHVARVLLPRAELRDAERANTVEAIDAYIASHPNSAIEGEVKTARRKALLDELDRAKKVGTVAALQNFAKKWPDSGLEPELRAAIHGLFVPALDAYHKRPPADPHVRSFVDRLFAWSEQKAHAGSAATTIEIRFRKTPSPTMRRADKMVSEHHWFIGEASYPSRYFDATHAAPREKAAADALGKQMANAFGAQVFTVTEGARLEDGDGPLPNVTEPTLFVNHQEAWQGLFDGSITKPRGIWVVMTYSFDALFVIPGDKEPLAFKMEVTEPLPKNVIEGNPQGGTPQAPLEDKIYGSMTDSAFRTFEDKYLATFLPAK